MKTTNANYDAENGLVHKPRFLLELDSLTDEYASGEFSGRNTSTQKLLLGLPEMSLTEIDPLAPNAQSLGSFRVDLLDDDNEISSLVANNTIYGRIATLKSLFSELTESDAIKMFSGRIVNYPLDAQLRKYMLEIQGAFPDLDKTIFTGLAEDATNGQFADYFDETTTTNALAAGSDVWIELTRNLEGIQVNDIVYLEHASTPSTNEIAVVKETRVNTTNLNLDIKCDLSNTYNSGSTVSLKLLRVDDASLFSTSVPANPPFVLGVHILVGREIMKYSARDTSLETLTISDRNLYLSLRERHRDNQVLKECWVIQDDPVTLMLNVMTTTAGGANGAYDLGVDGFGAGMDSTLIDFPTADNIRANFFASSEFRYIITEPQNCHDFLKELWKVCGIFPVQSGDGLLSFRRIENLTNSLSVDTITDDDIDIPESSDDEKSLPIRWTPGIDHLVNEVEFRFDWVPGRNEYVSNFVYELAESKTEFNRVRRLIIESKGLRNGLSASSIIDILLDPIAKRYGNPPPRLEMDLRYHKHPLDPGDVVSLTTALIPNLLTGARDLTSELMELVLAEPVPAENVMRIAGYLHNQVRQVNIGSVDSIVPADRTAEFNATDSAAVQSEDATYDNSADINVSANKITVKVRIRLAQVTTGNMSIDYHLRIGTDVHTATMTVEDDLDYHHAWIADKYDVDDVFLNTHVFEFGSTSVRDVKLDFYSRTGADAAAIDNITVAEIIYENDGAQYALIT